MIDTLDWSSKWAKYSPGKIAIKDYVSNRALTYATLNQQANALAHHFTHQLNLGYRSRITILAENCLEYLILFCAAQKTGLILVPLNYRLSRGELDFLLGNATPDLVIVEDKFQSTIESSKSFQQCTHRMSLSEFRQLLTDLLSENTPDVSLSYSIPEDHPILILYTSGSTGFPKGVLYTHKMLFWNSVNTALRLDLTAEERTLNCMPLFHTGGWNVLVTPLLHRGGYTCMLKQFDAQTVMKVLEEEAITIFMGVPTMIGMMSQTKEFASAPLNALKYFIVGGEPMPIPLIEKWAQKGIPIRQGFGMTEAGPNLTSLHHDDALRKKGSIGTPNFYVDTKIVKENGEEANPNETGELWIKGPIVTSGYWQNPAATEKCITDGWLHTGDLVRKDEEGYLYVVDRIKNMFISGGENIYPAEIERVIIQHPHIQEVAVVGIPHPKWGEVGKAFIVSTSTTSITQMDVVTYCQNKLAKFKIPKEVCFLDELPKNGTGKIDRKALSGRK